VGESGVKLRGYLAALLVSSACASSDPLAPSNGPWRFSGTVSRLDGSRVAGPVPGAELTLTDGARLTAKATSDTDGRYVFTGLETGRYTIVIVARGYVSVTPAVNLYRDTEANFALQPQ
jgi:hypothetical protein